MSIPDNFETNTDKETSYNKSPGWHVLIVLSLLMGFASISTDLYLPAMPAMGQSLSVNESLIALTISGYLVGFSLGQLIWGPISDRLGRRPIVAVGLILFIIGSAGCAISENLTVIIIWRVVQAFGACASVALSRAMVRDIYEGNKAAQMLSTLLAVMAIAPLIGPLLGGQIVTFASWRAIFWTLVGIGIITLIALYTIPETLPPKARNLEPIKKAIFEYFKLLKSRQLLGYTGICGFLYAGIFAYVAGTPFAYISYYHVPVQYYGFLFALGIIGIMIANIINTRMVPKLGYKKMLLAGVVFTTLSAISAAIASKTGWGGLWGIVVPLFLFNSTSGFVVANAITGALENFPKQAGAVSALIGSIQYGCGIIGSGLVGAFADGTPWTMGWVIGISGAGCLLSMTLILPPKIIKQIQ